MVPRLGSGLNDVRRIDGGDFEAGAGEPERKRQLARQVERLGRGDLLVERLEILERLVRSPGRLLGPVLDVVAQHHLRAQQRRERGQVLGHLGANTVGDCARELSEYQQRLRALASVHRIRLRFRPPAPSLTAKAGPGRLRLATDPGLVNAGEAAGARKSPLSGNSPLCGVPKWADRCGRVIMTRSRLPTGRSTGTSR